MAVLFLLRPAALWVVGGRSAHPPVCHPHPGSGRSFYLSSREPPSKYHYEERENYHLATVKVPVALVQTNYHKQGKLKITLC